MRNLLLSRVSCQFLHTLMVTYNVVSYHKLYVLLFIVVYFGCSGYIPPFPFGCICFLVLVMRKGGESS